MEVCRWSGERQVSLGVDSDWTISETLDRSLGRLFEQVFFFFFISLDHYIIFSSVQTPDRPSLNFSLGCWCSFLFQWQPQMMREGLLHLSPSCLRPAGGCPCRYSGEAVHVLPRPAISLSPDPRLSCLLKDIARAISLLFPVSSIFLSAGIFSSAQEHAAISSLYIKKMESSLSRDSSSS